jgi:uncharacterized membrane protein YbhN (UPF0104 family)
MVEFTQDLKKTYKTSAILYVAFMLSLVIYLIVFEVLKARIPDFQGMMEKIDFPWLRYAFYALGLVLFFLSGRAQDFYVLLIVSVILFVMYFPRYVNWEEWIKSRTSH